MTGAARVRIPAPGLFQALGSLFSPGRTGTAARAEERAEQLLDRCGDAMLRFAYSYLHNYSDAEDMVQEALIRWLSEAPRFESPAHEKAWLLRVTANLCKNRLAYETLRRTDELDESLHAEQREDLSFVWEAVRALPPSSREAVHLYYYEGLSTAEIAAVLDRKESTVRSDLRRGRLKLREILREGYDFA